MTSTRKPGGFKTRRGRPPLPAKARKGINFTFRGRGDLREKLGIAAKLSGRSISEEIERILEAHFTTQDAVVRALGGAPAFSLARPLLHYLSSLENLGFDWRNKPAAVNQVKAGLNLIFDTVLSGNVLPLKQWLPLLVQSEAKPELAANTLGKAIVELQLLGLAERPPPEFK